MLEFPEESIEQAREIVGKYRRRTKSKTGLAAQLFDLNFLHIHYGFTESIKTGNCGRYLHEVVKEAECFTMTGVLYLIAREAGLDPRIYWATGMKDTEDGGDPRESGTEDHSFVIVKTGKDREYIIDPQMNQWGEVRIFPEKNSMQIYRRKDRRVNERSYAHLQEIDQEEYLQKLEENRTSNGGRIALSATQKLKSGGRKMFVTYNPEKDSLKSSLRYDNVRLRDDPYKRNVILDLETQVNADGSFDFSKGDYSFYFAAGEGWIAHQDPLVPIKFSAKNAERFFEFLTSLLNGRLAKPTRSYTAKIDELLIDCGFHNNLSIFSDSDSERIVSDKRLDEMLEQIRVDQLSAAGDYVSRCIEDERSQRVLLREAHYVKESDAQVSHENPWGLISSETEREQFARESFKDYKRGTLGLCRAIFERREVEAGFRKGSEYHAERIFHRDFEAEKRKGAYFDRVCQIKKRFPNIFARASDLALSDQRFDLANMSLDELGSGISQDDLRRAGQKILFYFLTQAYVDKNALYLPSLRTGLRKILRKD